MNPTTDALRKCFLALKTTPPPAPWAPLLVAAVGGLREVGFSPDSSHLLVVSHDGRGVYDLQAGRRVARDPSTPDDSWHDERSYSAEGIGPLAGLRLPIAGLCGGTLPLRSADGWSLDVSHPDLCVVLQPPGASILDPSRSAGCTALDVGAGEFRAAGFSPDGRFLAIASNADVTLFGRP